MKTISDCPETLDILFSERIKNVPISFLREILKLTSREDMISFAGGVPNSDCFPIKELEEASLEVLKNDPLGSLQYSISEGYKPLREWIAEEYYHQYSLRISPDEILITNGSQQALDLIGKVLINPADQVLLEKPSYLGAIQAFSMYQPEFLNVEMEQDGPSIKEIKSIFKNNNIKLMYAVTDFQNPTGRRWSVEKRIAIAEEIRKHHSIIIEDNPYSEINFTGRKLPSLKNFAGENAILLGSFSKIIAPGFRIGWIAAHKTIINKMVIAKQATDLHSNMPGQKIIYSFLTSGALGSHLEKIRTTYGRKKETMIQCIKTHFPKEVQFENPAGGMFIWVTLPRYMNAHEILTQSLKEGVAFVPGETFYLNKEGSNTLRLSYSNSTEEQIKQGIERLGKTIKNNLKQS